MEEGSQDLLRVTVNPEGLAQLRRLASRTRWTFWGGFLVNLAFVTNYFLQDLWATNIETWKKSNLPFYIELKFHFWFAIVGCSLALSQLYQFWLFARRSATACEKLDSDRFNESLQLLNRFNRIALTLIFLNLVFVTLELWASLNFLEMRLHNSR